MNVIVDLTPIQNQGINGGSKVFILDLIDNLIKIDNLFKYHLLINNDNIESFERFINNDQVKIINQRELDENFIISNFSYFFRWCFKRKIKPKKISLFFYPFGWISQKYSRVPIVSIVYDCQHREYPSFFTQEEINHRENYLNDIGLRADLIIAISNYAKDSFYKFGYFKDRNLKVINIDCKRTTSFNNQNFQIALPKKYLLYPANFWPHKNHEMLLHSFSLALSHGLSIDSNLVLTGASSDRKNYLSSLAVKLNIKDKVHFIGYLSDDELTNVMINSYAVFYPSLYEGFGMPVLEALNLGVPVACSNIPPLREISRNAAFLFRPNSLDSFVKSMLLLDRKNFRERLRKRAKRFAKNSEDVPTSAFQYHNIFLSICKK
jgi:glycosyltransferase involved in cell wall biosynthesis